MSKPTEKSKISDAKAKKYYIQNKEMVVELKKYRTTKKISSKLLKMMTGLIKKISFSSHFNRYKTHEIEDMRSEAMISFINALLKFNFKKKKPFNYFSSVVINSYKYTLKKKYNDDNFKMEMLESCFNDENKVFINEIKKDMEKKNDEKHKKSNKLYFDRKN